MNNSTMHCENIIKILKLITLIIKNKDCIVICVTELTHNL